MTLNTGSGRGRDSTFPCPNCGAEVREGSNVCPECGSDEETGWSEGADVWDADIPTGYSRDDDFDYEEFKRTEFGEGQPRLPGFPLKKIFIVLIVAALAALIVALALVTY